MSVTREATVTVDLPAPPGLLAAANRWMPGPTPSPAPGPVDGHTHWAFVPTCAEHGVAVCLRQHGDRLTVETTSSKAIDDVARILSLDVDDRGWAEVGRRDPVIGRLQADHPSLRPVLFCSPFECGVWLLLTHRTRWAHAATIKARLTETVGDPVELHGQRLHAFPAPAQMLGADDRTLSHVGVPARKVESLRALAGAATEGRLDVERLRSQPVLDAIADLQELPGIGPFTAEGIVVRGAGTVDHAPRSEPRLGQALQAAYGLDRPPSPAQLVALADQWRPFRTWACVLLRVALADHR